MRGVHRSPAGGQPASLADFTDIAVQSSFTRDLHTLDLPANTDEIRITEP